MAMPQGYFYKMAACAVLLLVVCSQISATAAVETWQDPVDSNLRLYNAHVMSYFRICDIDESVHVHCRYNKNTCDAFSETTDFTMGNSTCLQIAFLHHKEEVANDTVISLVIRDAATLTEIVYLRREFVLEVVDDDALCQDEPPSPVSSPPPSSQATTEATSRETNTVSGDAESSTTETSSESGSTKSDSITAGVIPDTAETLVEGIGRSHGQVSDGTSTENNVTVRAENDNKIALCVFVVAFLITLALLILTLVFVVRMRRREKDNIGNASGMQELNLSGCNA